MKPTKQTVYLLVKVVDELPKESGFYKTEEEGTSFFQRGDQTWWDDDVDGIKRFPENWLKPQEGYFFTPEQLNEYFNKAKNLEIDKINDLFKKIDIEIIKIKYSYPQIWQGSTALTELTIKLEELKTQYLIFK